MIYIPSVREREFCDKEFRLYYRATPYESVHPELSSRIFAESVRGVSEFSLIPSGGFDTIIIAGDYGQVEIDFITAEEVVKTLDLAITREVGGAPAVDQGIFVVELGEETPDELAMRFSGGNQLNKIWLGYRDTIRLPTIMSEGVNGGGGGFVSDKQVVFGDPRYAYRTVSASFDFFDSRDKRELEKYFKAVQDIKPHYIKPFDEENEFAPMYGVLLNSSLHFERLQHNRFWRGFDLQWEEAR